MSTNNTSYSRSDINHNSGEYVLYGDQDISATTTTANPTAVATMVPILAVHQTSSKYTTTLSNTNNAENLMISTHMDDDQHVVPSSLNKRKTSSVTGVLVRIVYLLIGLGLAFITFLPNAMMSDSGSMESLRLTNILLTADECFILGGIIGCICKSWIPLVPGIILQVVPLVLYSFLSVTAILIVTIICLVLFFIWVLYYFRDKFKIYKD